MAEQELSDPITHRLPKDILEKLEKISKASDRSRSWYIVRALRFYFAGEGGDILNAIQGASRSIAARCMTWTMFCAR